MTDTIGGPRQWTNLDIPKGTDFDFDIEWLEEDGVTLIPIVSVAGWIKTKYDGDIIIDLSTVTTIDVNGRALIRISDVLTAAFPTMERAVWSCVATSAAETIELMAGAVRIREDV